MSASWNSQDLLRPVTDERPGGEDLEYTAVASFDADRLFGQTTHLDPTPERPSPTPDEPSSGRQGEKPRAPVDWGDIRTRALEALSKSRDLRLLAYLAAATLRTDGVQAFSSTLVVASGWLESYWEQAYPLLDDDPGLPVDEKLIPRRNALKCFADSMAIVEALRRLPLVRSRQHGTFSLRDIEIAQGQMQPAAGETPADTNRIDAAFAEMTLEGLQALQESVTGAIEAVKKIEATMVAQGGAAAQPEMDALKELLVKIDRVFRARLAGRADAVAETDAESAASGDGQPRAVGVGAIRTRQDAIRALDAVSQFFKANEPSSPVPMLIERAKRLVSKNFLEVLADIAPDAVPQARSAGGLSQEESG